MRAAVPEQFHHLDLARLGNRYRTAQLGVLLAGLVLGGLCSETEQAHSGKHGGENQVTHHSLLGRTEAVTRLWFDLCPSGTVPAL
ncbi:hypothetical protein D9M71_848260 [compost metagenome]